MPATDQYNGGFALRAVHVTAFLLFLLQLFWRFGLGGTLPVWYVIRMPGTVRWHPGGPEAAAQAFQNSPSPYWAGTGIGLFFSGLVGAVCLFFGQSIRYPLFGTRYLLPVARLEPRTPD